MVFIPGSWEPLRVSDKRVGVIESGFGHVRVAVAARLLGEEGIRFLFAADVSGN